jgi:CubicO group peptidase (beta-lactamase class C family)
MKKLLFMTCCICFNAAVSSQTLQGVPDDAIPLRPGTSLLSANYPSPAGNGFYKSDLCLNSVNTGTFIEFMDWLSYKVHYPGMQAAIVHDGELAWKHNWGMADIALGKPVSDTTLFRVLSVSKTMVVTSMMQQLENGFIDLNGNINDYLPFEVINPYYPQSVVTPKMVLTHSASFSDTYPGSGPECGLVEYTGDPQVSLHDFLESHFVAGGVCYSDDSYFNEPPGIYSYYSNPGASLGGYIVESVAGKGYNEYTRDSIFDLLDMPYSGWFYSEIDTEKVAEMYYYSGGQLIPQGFKSYAGYPLGDLKTNVTELSNFLRMYINHGIYNGLEILDSTSIDLITTIYDTIESPIAFGAPIGLIWQYWPVYPCWYHDGATGASVAFNKIDKSGFALTDNSRAPGNAYEPILSCSHLMAVYNEFAVSSLQLNDNDGDGIHEEGETIEVVTGIFNNMMDGADNVQLTLSVSDPGIQLINAAASLGTIPSGTSMNNQGQPFKLYLSSVQDFQRIMIDLKVEYNGNKSDTIHFPLFLGQGNILLVKDERDVLNSERFYLDVLDSLGMKTHYWDIAVNGNPDTAFLDNFPAIIWYTGYDQDSTVSEANQHSLIHYLDGGGNLFMTGQNISDEIGNTDFMQNYIHTSHNSNVSLFIVFGVDGDPLGDGMSFYMDNKNPFMPNQYSRSAVNALNGGIACFNYGYYTAGVRFENDIYKTVFLGFGFEAIDSTSNRYVLMQRILDYFGFPVGEDELAGENHSSFEIRLMPNPAGNQIRVSWPGTNDFNNLTVIDLSGREIFTLNPVAPPVVIDISGLPQGIYFLRVANDRSVGTGKFVKR